MAAALVLTLFAAGGLAAIGAPGTIALPGQPDGYAVRFALPAVHAAAAPADAPAARAVPLEVLAEPVESAEPEAAAPVTLASSAAIPVPTAVRSSPVRSRVPGVIALSYSLAGGANAGDAIEVEKSVTFRGADAGRIPLRIDGNAKVFALGSRLAAIIAAQSGQAAVPEGLEKDFVSLEALRALGIGVKYDAIRDRLVLDPPGA